MKSVIYIDDHKRIRKTQSSSRLPVFWNCQQFTKAVDFPKISIWQFKWDNLQTYFLFLNIFVVCINMGKAFIICTQKLVFSSKWLILGFENFKLFPWIGKCIKIFCYDDTARLTGHSILSFSLKNDQSLVRMSLQTLNYENIHFTRFWPEIMFFLRLDLESGSRT